jgi:DNA-binding beta-propeller fold protein YncE
MRMLTPFQALGAAAIVAMLTACSNSSAPAPTFATQRAIGGSAIGTLDRVGIESTSHRQVQGFYSCPRQGKIEYISDDYTSSIYVFTGKFAGQAPCGLITKGLVRPWGLFVDRKSHDLYVANSYKHDVLVFHRGALQRYNEYYHKDTTGTQHPTDVAVAKDGTLLVSTFETHGGPEGIQWGSVDTWLRGPRGGTFVNEVQIGDSFGGGPITVDKTGVAYFAFPTFNGDEQNIWSISCPAGVCGNPVELVPYATNIYYTGLRFDNNAGALLAVCRGQGGFLNVTLDTFTFPNPNPTILQLGGGYPEGMAIDPGDNHIFVANLDIGNVEFAYPSGQMVGSVQGVRAPIGVAVDP